MWNATHHSDDATKAITMKTSLRSNGGGARRGGVAA